MGPVARPPTPPPGSLKQYIYFFLHLSLHILDFKASHLFHI